jgi:HD-like signal output (HDOD) protein
MSTEPTTRLKGDRDQILRAATSLGILGGGAGSASRIIAELCNPDVRAAEVASLIGHQPSLCARVLRVSNSPYYGQARAVHTLQRALVVLGLEAVRGIAAAACLDRSMVRAAGSPPVDMEALLQHSIATAVAAESLARLRHAPFAAEAFIAGLLHNLGVAVQIQVDGAGIDAILAARRTDSFGDIRALELRYAAVHHEECAALIFAAWELPDSLVTAAGHHHEPLTAPPAHRDLAALVNLGAILGLGCARSFALESAPLERDSLAGALLGLDPAQVDAVAAALPDRVGVLRRALFGA